MIAQDYEYIRQQLITATADLSGSTKGQLVAFAENAQLATNRYKRKRLKVRDEETGRMITLHIAIATAMVAGKPTQEKQRICPA